MKVASTSLAMQSTRQASQSREISERLRVGSGRADPGSSRVALSEAARTRQADESQAALAAHEAGGVAEAPGDTIDDPRLQLLVAIIEAFTGVKIEVSRIRIDPSGASVDVVAPERESRPAMNFAYEYHESYAELERTTFSAAGVIRTADGKEIDFSLALVMQRSYRETLDLRVSSSDTTARKKDPLIVNFNGNAAQLTDARFAFDLDADGQAERIKLAAGNSAFLTLDRNGNGKVDHGGELFGAVTGDGFEELAQLDADGNGWIDEGDAAFGSLRLWSRNADGSDRLTSLQEQNVGALYLGSLATPFDLKDASNALDGTVARTGIYLSEDGAAGSMQKIDLTV